MKKESRDRNNIMVFKTKIKKKIFVNNLPGISIGGGIEGDRDLERDLERDLDRDRVRADVATID